MSLLSNAKWNSFSQIVKMLLQLINLAYLTKIIPPTDYGLMAMTAVITNFGVLLRDLGTAAAIIQRNELTERLKNTIFWLNTVMGGGIGLIIFITAPLISIAYSQPELSGVLMIVCVIFPISSSSSVHLSLMERESKFKKISMIEISSSLMSVIVAVILANLGFGVYSLVWQAVILSLMSSIQFWVISKWRPTFKEFFNKDDLKSILSFSANLSMFNFVNYFARNADSFIIGRYMSAAILGSYNLAYRIMLFPIQSMTYVASRSLYPVLSRNQSDNSKIVYTYYKSIFIILVVTTPLMSGVAVLSTPFINLFFGDKWLLTASILKFLAPTAIIQAVLSTTGTVFSAKGRTDLLFRLGMLGTILQVSAFIIGIKYDIITFSMLYMIANLLNLIPVMFYLLRLISGSVTELFKLLFPIFISNGLMLLSCFFINQKIIRLDAVDNYFDFFYIVLSCIVIYTFSLLFISREFRGFIKIKINIIKV